MEFSFHVAGMLDRDQRTAKPVLREKHESRKNTPSCSCCGEDTQTKGLRNPEVSHRNRTPIPGRTSPSTFRIREKQHSHFWVTLSRLHRTLILCFYLSLFVFPKTLSAPVKMEKWMMPCGHSESSSKSGQLELLQTIIDQSKRSLVKIEAFRDKFATKAFGNKWAELHEYQSSIDSLKWFPKITKELGVPVSHDELEKLQLEPLLKDTYQYLQIIAVAVDQMIIDETKKNGPLSEDYKNNIELYVLSVLCEIQTATKTLNIARHKDVERTIIDEKDKNGDNTTMMTRHYLIIRDYLRLLEYIIECYEHVKSKL